MSECHSPWRDRLSEYLDDGLSGSDREGIEAHLEACASCSRTLDELGAVVRRARSLEDRPPDRDLWPGIEAAIAEGRARDRSAGRLRDGNDGRSVEEPSVPGPRSAWAGTVRMSIPQLAAAALVVIALSGAGAWALLRGTGPDAPRTATGPDGPARVVAVEEGAPERIAPELAELERALEAARDELDPATVRILEKNLALIDRVIAESRRALELDPANPFLERYLDRAYQRKLEYLREAAAVAEWSS